LAIHYFKRNKAPGGGLVLTGSTSSYNERPNLPVYSTAKHAVIGLMRAIRHNAPTDNINVGAIAPGGTESALFTPAAADAFRALGIPVNRASTVALAAVYLANNKDTNGQAITIIGERFTEVEGAVRSSQKIWYGEYNTDMAERATSIRLDQLAKNR
jgi:short-subunit dehydrogenase